VFSVNPTALPVYGLGASNAATILAQETGDTGAFSQTNTCASIATIAPASSAGPSVTFTVTGVAAGTCTATFADTHNQTAAVTITVTTTGFTIQSHANRKQR